MCLPLREEVGIRGANVAAHHHEDLIFGIALDTYHCLPRRSGFSATSDVSSLGKGRSANHEPSTICDYANGEFMKKTATKFKIK